MPATKKPWHWLKAAMEAPGAFVMDPRGDLRLNVTPENDVWDEDHDDLAASDATSEASDVIEHTQQFLVCSKAMARTSAVFCKMLFGPFFEGQRDDNKAVDLKDAIEPMLFALYIVHSRYDMIPIALTVKELFQLLVVTNKYDMTSIVRPWNHHWVPLLEYIDEDFGDLEMVAWIAWEVGAEKIFELTIKLLALHRWVNEDGELMDWNDKLIKLNFHVDAAGIIDAATGLRKDLVSRMLSPLQQYARKITEGTTACAHNTQSDACDPAAMMSSIVPDLECAEVDDNLVYKGCAEILRCDIDQMRCPTCKSNKCNPIREATRVAGDCEVSEMDSPMTQSQRQHLAKQARDHRLEPLGLRSCIA
ncbi:unnamed protein product [Colletotrichum noveboracense]|uniref:BTB domain-containing protein n=1 Tax=Colletotrichum noveboracense TaxID=2664923 RepID=A0A9W4RQ14_9PEZI|nr:hypothetical protein COL940_002531 [Colletotrichum noveboracense]KAJ0293494.1 hypothetical protein CBS470a_001698 [Colletotrichum nupharicola]CAI0645534.1 unnamed protein product [Colletotrichum noveboracense]